MNPDAAKPYYQDELVTLYHGDCADILPSLPSVDLVLTDPPYSVSTAKSFDRSHFGKGVRNLDFFAGDQDWATMTASVVERVLLAAAKTNALYAWCGHRQFGRIVDALEADGWLTKPLAWSKRCPIPAPPGVGYDSALELCVYAFRDGRKWLPKTGTKNPNVIVADGYRHGQPGKWDHPTQKPISTMQIPLLNSTEPGDVILDPFAGSGTTLRVAMDNGRKAIGIEIEERYCELIAKRLSQGVLDFGEVSA